MTICGKGLRRATLARTFHVLRDRRPWLKALGARALGNVQSQRLLLESETDATAAHPLDRDLHSRHFADIAHA